MIIEQVSTKVVISGEAMIAGSSPTRFASNGRMQPISLEIITVETREKAMTNARATS